MTLYCGRTTKWLYAGAVKAPWLVALVACNPAHIPLDTPPTPWIAGPALPDPRFAPGATALGLSLAVTGGYDTPTTLTTRVDLFSTPDGTWSQLPDTPVARADPQTAAIGATLFLLGGFGSDGTARGDCYALDTSTGSGSGWQPIAAMPDGFARAGAAVVVSSPRIYLFGGAGSAGALASVIFYDMIADAWTTGALPDLPAPRFAPAAMRRAPDGLFVVAGGLAGTTADTASSDVDLLYLGSDAWIAGSAMPVASGDCAYGVVDGQLVCAGGEAGGSALADTQAYDSINNTWAAYAPLPEPRTGTPGAAIANALYVPGGAPDLTMTPTATLYQFRISSTAGM